MRFQIARSTSFSLIETTKEGCGRARGHVWRWVAASESEYMAQLRGANDDEDEAEADVQAETEAEASELARAVTYGPACTPTPGSRHSLL